MIKVMYSTKGMMGVGVDYLAGIIRVSLFSESGAYVSCRRFTTGEARAFIEYISCHLRFQCGFIHTVELTEAARDQLVKEIENSIYYLEAEP